MERGSRASLVSWHSVNTRQYLSIVLDIPCPMSAISRKMGQELRSRMKRFSHVNWSQVVRDAVEARIRSEESLAAPIDVPRAIAAVRRMDEMARRLRGGKELAGEVRKWRDRGRPCPHGREDVAPSGLHPERLAIQPRRIRLHSEASSTASTPISLKSFSSFTT